MPPLENRHEMEDALFKINRRIANLGTINPDAAEEYDALKVRYDYLAAQLDDLDRARRSLAKINRVIDARMKEDFIRTYEAVDRNFQEIFSILFPGGSANLSLVDPDDLENTGVEVNAQPKGKRIAKMMLLSGGEKSGSRRWRCCSRSTASGRRRSTSWTRWRRRSTTRTCAVWRPTLTACATRPSSS